MVLLLRHGQSTWNAEHRWQGWADPPLSDLGRRQADAAARWLAAGDDRFGQVVCSDLARARHTAEIVAAGLGLGPVEVDRAFRERDVGTWTGLTTHEIGRRWPAELTAWRERRLQATPGGEADPSILGRVLPALAALAGAGGGHVLVVTHGGVIRALERRQGGDPCVLDNLCGRWVELGGTGPVLGPAVALPALDPV